VIPPLGTDLPAATRAAIAALWRQRATSEQRVGDVFTALADELAVTGAHAEVVALARSAILDEARHAATCAALAAAYGDAAPIPPAPATTRLPAYTADLRLRATLRVINLSCLGETLATAFVERCAATCDHPALRELHRLHLADEIRHARVGWAHLATLTDDARAEVAPYLPRLLAAQVTAWERRLHELPAAGYPGHGYPPRATTLAALADGVTEVVLPGFAYVGLDPAPARAWFDGRPSPPPSR
jgi:hypothetical protein